jgi:uncharacterized membrane protein HdeD (DUF308 family)
MRSERAQGAPAPERSEVPVLLASSTSVNLHLALPGIIALIAGIVILIFPKVLNYIVAAYLIIVGLIQVFNVHI